MEQDRLQDSVERTKVNQGGNIYTTTSQTLVLPGAGEAIGCVSTGLKRQADVVISTSTDVPTSSTSQTNKKIKTDHAIIQNDTNTINLTNTVDTNTSTQGRSNAPVVSNISSLQSPILNRSGTSLPFFSSINQNLLPSRTNGTTFPISSTNLPGSITSRTTLSTLPNVSSSHSPTINRTVIQLQTTPSSSIVLPGGRVQSQPVASLGKNAVLTSVGDDKIDYTQLNDAMAFTGVNLKEETEILVKPDIRINNYGGYASVDSDRSRIQNFLDPLELKFRVDTIAKKSKLASQEDLYDYLALATEDYIRSLLEQMRVVKNHRINSHHLHNPPLRENNIPLYKEMIHQDVRAQLLAIERVEREQERKRKERFAKKTQSEKMQGIAEEQDKEITDPSQQKKKKRKNSVRDPSSRPQKQSKQSAKQLSEDKTKMNTNETALKAAGGLTKSWMLAAVLENSSSETIGLDSSRSGSNKLSGSNKTLYPGHVSGGLKLVTTGKNVLPPQSHPVNEAPMITVRDALQVLEFNNESVGNKIIMRGYAKYLR